MGVGVTVTGIKDGVGVIITILIVLSSGIGEITFLLERTNITMRTTRKIKPKRMAIAATVFVLSFMDLVYHSYSTYLISSFFQAANVQEG